VTQLRGGTEPWLAIFNPASGNSDRRTHWRAIAEALRAAGLPLETVETRGPGHGAQIARDAVVSGRRRLLIAGGDGSAHEVVNGVMRTGTLAGEATLALAPLGTGNDWARTLGVTGEPRQVAALLRSGRTVAHDVGTIEFAAESKTPPCWFINVAGAGYDAFVLSRLPARTPSPLSYLRGAIGGLLQYRPPRFLIRNAGRAFDERLWVAFVANGRFCGNGMHVAPRARTDDGRLDVVAIAALHPARVLARLPKLYRGTIAADPAVRSFTTDRLRIDATPAAAVQADGQLVGSTPAEFAIVPGALRVLVAPGGAGLVPRRGTSV
jgi:YegS/Rv2252/BmrU family lipid kinase